MRIITFSINKNKNKLIYMTEEERIKDREYINSISILTPELYDSVFAVYQKYSKNCNSYLTGCGCNCDINNLFNQLKNMI